MRRTVQPDDIIKINEAYLLLKNYTATATATGWSATTVRKYIIPNYQSQNKQENIQTNIELPPIEEVAELLPPWYDLTCLTEEEEQEIKELWSEIII